MAKQGQKTYHLTRVSIQDTVLTVDAIRAADGTTLDTFKIEKGAAFKRGDPNNDAAVNITDPIHILNYLFLSGPVPACLDAADTNDDGDVNITDPIFLLGYLFLGLGPLPPPSACGLDPTADGMRCSATFTCAG